MQERQHTSAFRIFQKSILLYVFLCVLSAVFAVGQAQIFSGIVSCTLGSEMSELLRLARIMLGIVAVYYAGRILLKNRQADERDRASQNFREKMAADFFGQPVYNISHTQGKGGKDHGPAWVFYKEMAYTVPRLCFPVAQKSKPG